MVTSGWMHHVGRAAEANHSLGQVGQFPSHGDVAILFFFHVRHADSVELEPSKGPLLALFKGKPSLALTH
jgi:hypothetical protein